MNDGIYCLQKIMITRNYTFYVEADKEVVQKYLEDLTLYAQFHPLIQSAELLSASEEGATFYRINEKPFSFLPATFKYRAQVISNDKHINYEILDIPFYKPSIYYEIEAASSLNTRIHFTLKIESWFLGKNFLAHKMMQAQIHLMEALNDHVNS